MFTDSLTFDNSKLGQDLDQITTEARTPLTKRNFCYQAMRVESSHGITELDQHGFIQQTR